MTSNTNPLRESIVRASPIADARVEHLTGEAHDALLVAAADHERPVRAEHLLDGDDLADLLVPAGLDHGQRLVQHDLLAGQQA